MSNFWLYIIFFCFGLIAGSFANAFIWRSRERISILKGRSMCPNCRKKILWHENIPLLSYIFLRGKCSGCKTTIPLHYFLVELFTGLGAAFIFWFHSQSAAVNYTAFFRDEIFFFILAVLFTYDFLYQEILTGTVWAGLIFGFLINIVLGFGARTMLAGLLVGGGFFFLQYIISKGKWIGGGDARMGMMMGIWLGWPSILVALMLAYILGAAVSLIMVALKKKTLASATPFGTYLAVGTLISILWGGRIITWYLLLVK